MVERVLELVRSLSGGGGDEEAERTLCAAACGALDRRMKDGVAPEDCGESYCLAAAWMAIDWLRESRGLEGVTALSAGDISVRREGSGGGGRLPQRALDLMRPFLRDEGFVFRGVES